MNIKEITVSASMSKNYQKAEFSITAEITSEEEKEYLRSECVTQASLLLDQLCSTVAAKEDAPTTVHQSVPTINTIPTQQKPTYRQPQPAYKAPVRNVAPVAPVQNTQFRPVSQKQLAYLKGLGYQGPTPSDWANADIIIKQLKQAQGLE